MADLKYYDVIIKPIMTEKSMHMMENRQYSFYVHPEATKIQIREAIERMFEGTEVDSINTLLTHPKKRHRREYLPGKTTRKKKAVVTLTAGSREIELFQGL